VALQVFLQRVASGERLSALVAGKGSDAGVRPDVRLQSRTERLVADGTGVGLVALVQPLVVVQVAAVGERLAALVALERFVPVVPVQVHHQVAPAQKTLVAHCALERPLLWT